MTRILIVCVLLTATSSARADGPPERLIPAGAQLYLRWDGIAAHRDAYEQLAVGRVLAGDTGRALRGIARRIDEYARSKLLGNQLLRGVPPDELRQLRADWNATRRLPELLADHGIIIAAELQKPSGTIRKLIDGQPLRDALTPRLFLTVIVPGAGGDAEPLYGSLRLATRDTDVQTREAEIAGRKVRVLARPDSPRAMACWSEGEHLVISAGNATPEQLVRHVTEAGDGITQVPAYRRLRDFEEFRVASRGYFDAESVVKILRPLTAGTAPEVWTFLDETGVTGLKEFRLWGGFDGDTARTVLEATISEGTKPVKPLKLDGLPPLPKDVTRWAAARIDLVRVYDLLHAFDAAISGEARTSPEELNRAVGFDLRNDLLAALDDRVVTYHTPGEVATVLGQALAVEVRDEAKLRRALDRLGELLVSNGLAPEIQDGEYHGVPVRQIPLQFVGLNYTIHDGWLVLGLFPQTAHGYILRSQGKIPSWEPDQRTAKRLAALPADVVAVQYCDPRVTIKRLLSFAPMLAGLGNSNLAENPELTVDVGLVPHPEEVCAPLFPNVTFIRNDGTIWRWESFDSLYIPPEIGPPGLLLGLGLLN